MMNSDCDRRSQRILSRILEELDEKTLKQEIDDPIDRAVNQFAFSIQQEFDYRCFLDELGAFIRHVYSKGFPVRQNLVKKEAIAEGISVLTRMYEGESGRGFDAAVLDASAANGTEIVLRRLAEQLKENQRQKQIRWIFDKHIQSCDWRVKVNIAEFILLQQRDNLSPGLKQASPEQFVDCIPALLSQFLSTDSLLEKIIQKF